MAKLPRYAALHLTLAALLCAADAGARERFDPVGTWYVLVHYTDDNSARPDAMRWEDRVWVFERSGDRLRWSEYPIVVFQDRDGRFEALGTNRASRIVHAWEPDEAQLDEIRSGLEVNPRGRKTKTLRAADEGWRSNTRAMAASASVVTYTEHWSLLDVDELPVFERFDQLGSARTETLDGVTRYTTTEIEPGGDVLRGRFERDGTRRGTFRMMRAGAVGDVKGSGKTQGERFYEAFFGEELGRALLSGQKGLEKEMQRRIEAGEEIPEEAREELRQEIRRSIERSVRRKGGDPGAYRREIDSLTDQVEKLILEEGRSLDEVREMLEKGEIAP